MGSCKARLIFDNGCGSSLAGDQGIVDVLEDEVHRDPKSFGTVYMGEGRGVSDDEIRHKRVLCSIACPDRTFATLDLLRGSPFS